MIRGFLQILGPQRGRMYAYLAWVTVYGVLHGVAMTLLVPISVALFDERYGDAGRWLGVLAVVVLVAAVAQYVQATLAIRMALATMRLLHHRLGDHMVTLPLGWFNRETVGRVSQIAVKGTVFVGTSGALRIGRPGESIRADCLAYVEERWTDMRPRSLRDAMALD